MDKSLDVDYFEVICNISPVGLFRTDENGNILYVNARYEKLTGKKFNDLEQDKWISTIYEKDRNKVLKKWNQCIKENMKFVMEYRIINNSKIIWVLGQATPIKKGSGFVGTLTNINKRKTLLSELLTLRESK
jgi:PAS domain S-box-containing protein